jgi:deazaflavin-dependent oxidoreductase (nitroreductase family)
MTITSQRAAHSALGAVQPVLPSRAVRILMRPLTKKLNPVILNFAGGRRFPMAAQLTHVGRRSGRTYVTPVSARRTGDVVLIALTFGNRSDWARNVWAAGGCALRMDGVEYQASGPAFVSRADAATEVRAAFSPFERLGVRMLGIKQFMRLDVR